MKLRIYDLNTEEFLKTLDLLEEIKEDAEEFLNNRYNIGFFHVRTRTYNIQLKTCDIYLTLFGYTKKGDSTKVGRLAIEPLNIKIWIPEEREYP